jgi:hypothetical protein
MAAMFNVYAKIVLFLYDKIEMRDALPVCKNHVLSTAKSK